MGGPRMNKKPKKVRHQHVRETDAERFWAPPPGDTENPDWLVGAY